MKALDKRYERERERWMDGWIDGAYQSPAAAIGYSPCFLFLSVDDGVVEGGIMLRDSGWKLQGQS